MPENPWPQPDANPELDSLSSLIADWVEPDPEDEEEEFRSDFFRGTAGRRRKAAFTLMVICSLVFALHLVAWGHWLVWSFTGMLVVYNLRLLFANPDPSPEPLSEVELAAAPTVSLLVSAKNEEAVIERLVDQLCCLDYPRDRYDVWVVDDYSTDQTPEILDRLAPQYNNLHIIHRPANAGGGKSGALNQAVSQSQGAFIAVFDADAVVEPDLLRRVMPCFKPEDIGAVQVRKAVANPDDNFWTRGQYAEMALDSYFQQQRIASGGIGELRGNGQFVRRQALYSCGGWNEETITDDLDLTFRLHLDQWNIGFCLLPAVNEEGVTQARALWHQRSRWAEGGYQRYLDYWRWIVSNRMGFAKTVDLLHFFWFQYVLPTAAIPDLIMTLKRHDEPLLLPLSTVMIVFAAIGMIRGLLRIRAQESGNLWTLLVQTVRGMIYTTHWFVVMPATTSRMSVRQKRLKWVKTVHEGNVSVAS
ncbi:MAG: glycosyltransferase family 2 protein [Spirulina sp. SIO3F2]|nr:glycosyltransferase family 2 protein [Spirulina sp. SIO3F2]